MSKLIVSCHGFHPHLMNFDSRAVSDAFSAAVTRAFPAALEVEEAAS